MNILILTTHMNIGGIATYVVRLAGGLVKRGHNALVASSGGDLVSSTDVLNNLSLRGSDSDRSNLKNVIASPSARNDIYCVCIKLPRHKTLDIMTKCEFSPKLYNARRILGRLVRDEKTDLIHAQTRVTQVLADALSRDTGIPYVTTCHGFFQPRLSRRLFPCWGERVIAISEAVKKHLIEVHRVREDKIRLIYNGVEVDKTQPSFKEGPEVVIGMLGRLVKIKGHEILLKAMPQVINAHPKAKALIVGEGEMRPELERLAGKLGLRDRVAFMDNVPDTKEVLARMSLFVAPNTGLEGLGLSILEAMATGLPVVASRIGGIESLIQDGVSGLLVEPADEQALAEAILRVLKDARLAGCLGEEARRTASEKFSVDRMVEQTLEVYREVRGSRNL